MPQQAQQSGRHGPNGAEWQLTFAEDRLQVALMKEDVGTITYTPCSRGCPCGPPGLEL